MPPNPSRLPPPASRSQGDVELLERLTRARADLLAQVGRRIVGQHQVLDGILTVSEAEILSTVGLLARRARLVAEPSGAVTTAAYLHRAAELPTGPTVAVVSGGNIDPALFDEILRDTPPGD